MASPEQLSRRVNRAEQNITAISDTLLDVQETVHAHTETLADHGRQLGEIRQEQERQATRLDEVEQRMTEGFAAIMHRLEQR
ncbi:MAG: hypothetical protein ACRDQ5_22650 [Sciscionella sp.]